MFRLRVITLLLAAASLGACAADPADHTLDVTFDVCQPIALVAADDATAAERQAIIDAAAMWTALGPYPIADEGEDAQRIDVVFQDAAAAFHGFYDDTLGVVFVNRGLADDHQRAVTVAHELGHAFGLLHVGSSARPSVMNPANLAIEPTPDDAAALTALWGECAAVD